MAAESNHYAREAEELLERIGGFAGDSAPELSAPAQTYALLAVAEELRLLRVSIEGEPFVPPWARESPEGSDAR